MINGKLFVGGGANASSVPTNVLECYDPVTDSWITLAPLPTIRGCLQGGVVDNKLYTAGGFLDGPTASFITEVYDPIANTWSTTVSMPTARGCCASAVVDNKLYIAGGNLVAGVLWTVEGVIHTVRTLVTQHGMIKVGCNTHGATGISRRRLDEDVFELGFAQHAAIGYTV